MDNAQPVKAISFDGDMTLWDFQKVMHHSLSVTLAELRRRLPGSATAALTIDQMIETRNSVAAELKGKIINLEEIRLQAFRRTLQSIGYDDQQLAVDLNALYLKHRFEDIELYPDVHPCLKRLGNYTLGLLSNGNSYPKRCGLSEYFQFAVFSQDIGSEKPDEKIFLAACQQAGCAPHELLHVGDSLAADVVGANRVGAMSVWLNRNADRNESGIVPDYEVRSLTEVIEIVRQRQ